MSEVVDPFDGGSGGPSATPSDNGSASAEEPVAVNADERVAAVGRGRLRGEHEAESRGETDEEYTQRVARSMAYAAWEADGKPPDRWDSYREEFGVTKRELTASADRAPLRQPEEKKKSKGNG